MRTLSLAAALLMAACTGTATQSDHDKEGSAPAGAVTAAPAPNSPRAGALAIADSMIGELNTKLIAAGLSDIQAQAVDLGALAQAQAAAGQLSIEAALRIADAQKPLVSLMADAIMRGAFAAMGDQSAAIDNGARAPLAKVIVGSIVVSAGTRSADLSQAEVLAGQKSMVGAAVENLTAAGLTQTGAVDGLFAVASGATEALIEAKVASDNAAASAGAIAQGAVESLLSCGLAASDLGGALNATSSGVVSSLAKAGVSPEGIVAAAGSVTQASVASLKSLSLGDDALASAAQATTSGAVGALSKTGVDSDGIGAAAQQLAQSAVSGLKDAGVAADKVGAAAGAVAGGAIQGLTTAGLSTDQIIQSGAIAKVVSGAISGVSAAGVSSSNASEAMGQIAGGAVGSLAGGAFASVAQKTAALGAVISGAMQGAQNASPADAGFVAATLSRASSLAVQALPQAGFAAADMPQAIGSTVSAGMTALSALTFADASVSISIASKMTEGMMTGAAKLSSAGVLSGDATKSVAAAVGTGALDGLSTLQSAGKLNGSSDFVSFSGAIAKSTMTGLAYGGASTSLVTSVQASVTTAFTSDAAMAKLGVTDAVKQQIAANVGNTTAEAITFSQAVQAGFPACADSFADSRTDGEFWSKVVQATPPVLCARAANGTACPIARGDSSRQATWRAAAVPGACELSINYIVMPALLAPSIVPASGQILATGLLVALKSPDMGATLYYTLDGTEPSAGHGLAYASPFWLMQPATVKVIAIRSGSTASPVVGGTFVAQAGTGATTNASTGTGTSSTSTGTGSATGTGSMTGITSTGSSTGNATTGGSTTGGSTTGGSTTGGSTTGGSTTGGSTTGGSTTSGSTTSMATTTGVSTTGGSTGTTTGPQGAITGPTFMLPGDTYPGPLTLALIPTEPGSIIKYTLDGTTPGIASGQFFQISTPIILSPGVTTVRAIAILGSNTSNEVQEIYTVTATSPMKAGITSENGTYVLDHAGTNIWDLNQTWSPRWTNLIGYWPMNGSGTLGSNATTPSLIGTSGVAAGGAAYEAGKLSQALRLVTSQHLDLSANAQFNAASFTISAWFKTAANSDEKILCEPYQATDWHCPLTIVAGHLNTCVGDTGCVGGGPLVNDDAWHFATAVGDNGQLSVYLDGNPQPLDSLSAPNHFYNQMLTSYDFEGALDDVAVYNSPLTSAELAMIYERQSPQRSGLLTSGVETYGAPTARLSWQARFPFGKQLPDFSSEAVAYYPLVVPGLTGGIAGLWHFDESAPSVGPHNDLRDTSGYDNYGELSSDMAFGAAGPTSPALHFDGSVYVDLTNPIAFSINDFTVSAWVKTTEVAPPGGYMSVWNQHNTSNYSNVELGVSNGKAWYTVHGAGSGALSWTDSGTTVVTDGHWHLLTLVRSGDDFKLYTDSHLDVTHHVAIGTLDDGPVIPARIGAAPAPLNNRYFVGDIDEVAVWIRALSQAEVTNVYARVANRVKIQIRKCYFADCSDQMPWRGPDGTPDTYFSEADNKPGGIVSMFPPDLYFSPSSGIGALTGNYFQYRAILESDTGDNACVGLSCMPQLQSVQIMPSP